MLSSSTHMHLVDSTNPGNVLSNFVKVHVERLVVWSLEPFTGPEDGGYSITVFGQVFDQSKPVKCRFHETASVTANLLTSSTIRCISPNQSKNEILSSAVNVDITVGDQVFVSSGVVFTYEAVLPIRVSARRTWASRTQD